MSSRFFAAWAGRIGAATLQVVGSRARRSFGHVLDDQPAALEAVSPFFGVPLGWGLEATKDTHVVDRSVVQLLALFFGQRVVTLVGLREFSSAGEFVRMRSNTFAMLLPIS
jgi:hypothetical protein